MRYLHVHARLKFDKPPSPILQTYIYLCETSLLLLSVRSIGRYPQHDDPFLWACERRIGCGSGQKLLEFATHGQNIFGQDHTPLRRSLDIVLKWQKDGYSRSGGCSVAAIILSLLESRVGKSQRNLNIVRKHTCRWHSGSYELLCQHNIPSLQL